MKKIWQLSDVSNSIPIRSNILEFQDNSNEWHVFEIIATQEKIVFGGSCNVGFLESGYICRNDIESLDETLSELFADLQTYYNDGYEYCSRIVCNKRM